MPRAVSRDEPVVASAKPVIGGNERILLAEDEEQIRQMLKKMLEGIGYNVTACSDGIEALGLFTDRTGAFDLIVTDLIMPKMTGLQLALKIMEISPGFPIILISGFMDEDVEQKAKAAGIGELAVKPVYKADMADIIRRVLEVRSEKENVRAFYECYHANLTLFY